MQCHVLQLCLIGFMNGLCNMKHEVLLVWALVVSP